MHSNYPNTWLQLIFALWLCFCYLSNTFYSVFPTRFLPLQGNSRNLLLTVWGKVVTLTTSLWTGSERNCVEINELKVISWFTLRGHKHMWQDEMGRNNQILILILISFPRLSLAISRLHMYLKLHWQMWRRLPQRLRSHSLHYIILRCCSYHKTGQTQNGYKRSNWLSSCLGIILKIQALGGLSLEGELLTLSRGHLAKQKV